jgi:hypothetical protein
MVPEYFSRKPPRSIALSGQGQNTVEHRDAGISKAAATGALATVRGMSPPGEFWVELRPAPGQSEELIPEKLRGRQVPVYSIRDFMQLLSADANVEPTDDVVMHGEQPVHIFLISALGED